MYSYLVASLIRSFTNTYKYYNTINVIYINRKYDRTINKFLTYTLVYRGKITLHTPISVLWI